MPKRQAHADGIADWLSILRVEGIGPVLFRRLLDRFGDPASISRASFNALTKIQGVGTEIAQRLKNGNDRGEIDAELRLADKLGVYLIHLKDPRYPCPLRNIFDPPPVLYVKGRLNRAHTLAVAVVGARRCSLYGREQASRLSYQMAAAGFTVVSGMAMGIDTAAHQGALAAGGQTLAVQGCGLAQVFPPENRRLFEKIADTGACLSEFPLNYEPLRQNFPARNRIIAGLAMGTVVVEASQRSGALITARCAMEQNREVMAVPGRVDSPLSQGPHRLLRDGATLVTSAEEIAEALGTVGEDLRDHVRSSLEKKQTVDKISDRPRPALNREEQEIYALLSETPQHADHVVTHTRLPTGTVTATLVGLQLKGVVRSLPGNLFVKRI